jgi:putative colanic acid biosynthesis acetyltransferase WcaF
MMQQQMVDNSIYKTSIDIKAGKLKQVCWYAVNVLFFKNPFVTGSGFKIFLLRLFGAVVGRGVVIKPCVNIKYAWKLSIGNYSWIGEQVWIDNLAEVSIGNNVCISQGAFLLTGNHNYKKVSFDLMLAAIVIKDGVWIGAKAVVCPGVVCNEHAVLSVSSVASSDLNAWGIYRGNPAGIAGQRVIEKN